MSRIGPFWWRLACLTLLASAAYVVGVASRPTATAEAGVRQTTPKQHFLTGDQQSVPILQDIAATLKQIDARVAKIEKTVAEIAARDAAETARKGRR